MDNGAALGYSACMRSAFLHAVWAVLGGVLLLGRPAGAGAPFSDGCLPTAVLYVATNGNDSTGTGTLAQPFRTISRGLSSATSGVAVTIRPGVYNGDLYVEGLAGTTSAPIWIRGESATNRPVLQGGSEGLHLTRVRYVVVENLEITGASQNGLNCDDDGDYANPEATRWVVFSNLYIHHIGFGGNQDGLKLSGVYDYWVLNSEFAFCGGSASGSGVDHVGCHRGVIEGCYFHDLSANAVQCKGGSSDIEIRGCRIVNAGVRGINIGGSTDFEFFRPPLSTTRANYEAADIRVVANLFQGCTAAVAYVGCVTSVVANNTIHSPSRWIARILQETVTSPPYEFLPCGNNQFNNNIVYFDSSLLASHLNIGGNTAPSTFLFANNLWYAYNQPSASTPTLAGTVTNNLAGLNPLFGNPAQSNYTITLLSPAATNGRPLSVVSNDFDLQPYLSPPSRGAYEIAGDVDADGLPDVWEIRWLGTAAYDGETDPDEDHFRNREEYLADTHPGDAASWLGFLAVSSTPEGRVLLRWQGGGSAVQQVDQGGLNPSGAEASWQVLQTHFPPVALTNELEVSAGPSSAVFRLRSARP